MNNTQTGVERSRRPMFVRAVVLVSLGAVLTWQTVTRGLASFLADRAPETALEFLPTEPTALLGLAESLLSVKPSEKAEQVSSSRLPAPDPVVSRDVGAKATLALLNDPLNARAFRILGKLAEAAGDEPRAAQLLETAAKRSLRESTAVFWLMRKSFEQKDYSKAAFYADALLRSKPGLTPDVVPTLAQMAESKEARGEIKAILVRDPPWRAPFFDHIRRRITDARTPLNLLLVLRDTPSPPTVSEIEGYLKFLVDRDLADLAYYAWLQFLPPEQLAKVGLLFNGGFELPLSGLIFDWVISRGSGVTIDVAKRPDREGERALVIEFGVGRADFKGVSQLVTLAPGDYELKGQYKGDISGKRGVLWRVECAAQKNQKTIGVSAMVTGAAPAWTEFTVTFTVPATDCRAQRVGLESAARSASEQLMSGSIWFDDLRLSRVLPPEPPPVLWPGIEEGMLPPNTR